MFIFWQTYWRANCSTHYTMHVSTHTMCWCDPTPLRKTDQYQKKQRINNKKQNISCIHICRVTPSYLLQPPFKDLHDVE